MIFNKKRNILYGFILLLISLCTLILLIVSIVKINDCAFAVQNDVVSTQSEQDNSLNLINNDTLTVAVSPDYPPFAELVNNNIVGFEPDIYKEIANRLGLNIEEKIMNFDTIITSVASGEQCDIGMACITKNPDREKIVNFSDSYYQDNISFVVDDKSKINSSNANSRLYDDSLTFAVQSGSSSEDYVRENFRKANCITYGSSNDCFAAVLAGQVDVACASDAVSNSMLKGSYSNMKIIYTIATGEEFGIISNKENAALLSVINKCLSDMKNDGSLEKIAIKNNVYEKSRDDSNIENLQTIKCVAKANSLASNDVINGKETRITWEGQAGDNQTLSGFTFNLPPKTQFSSEDVKTTMIYGNDNLSTCVLKTNIECVGTEIKINFIEPSQIIPGVNYRVEIYDVIFAEGSKQANLSGSYKLIDNSILQINDIYPIELRDPSFMESLAFYVEQLPAVIAWNSNQFCNLFLNPSIFLLSIPVVFCGFLMALAIVICAFPLAIPIGLLLSIMRISTVKILRGIATTYVNVIRGTPLFLQIYIAFFGLPLAGINIPSFLLGLIVLSINSSAYLCEIFRAGIQSIPKGQFEASLSLGMTKVKTMFYVIMPQTFQRCIPTMTSEFILLFKDTSLLASVGVMEVVMFARTVVASTGSITPYIVAAIFYLIVTLPLARYVGKLEKKFTTMSQKTKKKKNKNLERDAYKRTIRKNIIFPSGMNKSDSINSKTYGSV